MSDASHASGAHESHSAHAHEVYEGKPADTIPPDEPHSPGWLPIVGIALTLAAILFFAVRHEDTPSAEAAEAAASAAPEAPPEPAAPAPARAEGTAPARNPTFPGIPSAFMRPRPGSSAQPAPPGARIPGQGAGAPAGQRPARPKAGDDHAGHGH